MLRTTLFAALFASATTTALQAPCYAPDDSPLRRSVALHHELEFEMMTVTMGGVDVPSEYLPRMEMSFESERRIVSLDRVLGVEDGRPTALVRSYDEILGREVVDVSVEGSVDEALETEGSGALSGETIRFEWDADEGGFVASLEGDESADADGLEGLGEDLDLRVLLPEESAEVGDRWEVDGADCAFFFAPGGELSIEWEVPGDWERPAEEELEGTLEVRWTGVEDGAAVLVVSGILETAHAKATDLEQVPVTDGTATETTRGEYAVEGRVHWSLEEGRLVDAELSAQVAMEIHTVRDEGQEGAEYEHMLELSGNRTLTVEVGAAE